MGALTMIRLAPLALLFAACGGKVDPASDRAAPAPMSAEQLRLNARADEVAKALRDLKRYTEPKVVHPIVKPRAAQLDLATLGPEPSSEVVKASLKRTLDERLKYPDSAKLEVSAPCRGYYFAPKSKECRFGWRVDFTYDAKNGFGNFVGKKCSTAFIVRGEVVAIVLTDFASFDQPNGDMEEIGDGGLTPNDAGLCDYYDAR